MAVKVYCEATFVAKRNELQAKLNVLKRNIDGVGLPTLKTKYAEGYRRLCNEISGLWEEVVDACESYLIVREDVMATQDFQTKLKSYQKELDKILFEDCNAEQALILHETYKLNTWSEHRNQESLMCYKLPVEKTY